MPIIPLKIQVCKQKTNILPVVYPNIFKKYGFYIKKTHKILQFDKKFLKFQKIFVQNMDK